MHLPNPSLFRAYDVRGIVGESLHAADFIAIGHAFASHVAEAVQCRTPLIVAMRDGRSSSPNLMEAMIEGMQRAGAHVLDGGVGPTPACYFATHHLDADGCVMITGSHNPPSHNGAKFMRDGKSLYGSELASLRKRIESNELLHSRGHREEIHLLDEYVDCLQRVLKDTGGLNQLSIAWDAGNGAAGLAVQELIDGALAPQTALYLEIDAEFPNHHPDPAEPKNMADLQRAILASNGTLALGVAFDGDGDRLGAVDDLGRLVSPDHLLMLFADDVLKRHPDATIIADVKTSDTFFDRVKNSGGTPLMWMTGHAHIKTKMPDVGAKFAGEASGHIFFADEYYGYDDGIYAALRLIRIVAQSGKKLSALIDALPPMQASAEMRIACADDKKFAVVEAIAKKLLHDGATVNTLDGVRVSTPDGWWLLRASNTQAALVARAEGATPESTAALVQMLQQLLQHEGVAMTLDASN
jgi:phosphomannomutase